MATNLKEGQILKHKLSGRYIKVLEFIISKI
jgi:hypothetical protein